MPPPVGDVEHRRGGQCVQVRDARAGGALHELLVGGAEQAADPSVRLPRGLAFQCTGGAEGRGHPRAHPRPLRLCRSRHLRKRPRVLPVGGSEEERAAHQRPQHHPRRPRRRRGRDGDAAAPLGERRDRARLARDHHQGPRAQHPLGHARGGHVRGAARLPAHGGRLVLRHRVHAHARAADRRVHRGRRGRVRGVLVEDHRRQVPLALCSFRFEPREDRSRASAVD
mmetsp:Transcript_41946/g.99556  ORF Transcript_41946/g.99556 Transcript_41946/m.99556 type:complete len:226 (-) Transcript_41946:29-706(-)